jgi:ABC-type nitrate/sulfonate/bicarbonate transport system ATPase subunit
MKPDYTNAEVLIKGENIGLTYGDRTILHSINFEVKNVIRPGVEQGQVVALIGRSGMGKTQLFRIIAGLNKPTTGSVRIDADQHLVDAGEVGIIPQNYILFQHRTVFQNLKIGLSHSKGKKRTAEEATEIIKKYAADFELSDHLQKYPAQLSGGQRQRVSILQQVLTENKFILLDEPFSGLDTIMIDKVINLLLKVSTLNELNTLVMVSHDIENALAISDLVWLLAPEAGKEGATITKEYDLKEMGLAWEPEIRKRPEFHQLVAKVKSEL